MSDTAEETVRPGAAPILSAWEELHGTDEIASTLADTETLPFDSWRRFERSRGHGSRDKPGRGMFGVGQRWLIAIESNEDGTDLVVGELANIKHIEAVDDVLTITSNRGHVFRLVFEDPVTAVSLDDEISAGLGYFDVGEPLAEGRVEHLSVIAVLAPSGGMRPQADTSVKAGGVVTQSWSDLDWFVAVPGTLQEPIATFMNRAGAAGWELVAAVPLGYQEAKTLGEAIMGDWLPRDQRLSTLRAQHLHFKRRTAPRT